MSIVSPNTNPTIDLELTNRLIQIFEAQHKANEVHLANLDTPVTTQNWKLYSIVEIVELIDSLDYKHWAKKIVDVENIKMELVDIFKFLSSEMLSIYLPNTTITSLIHDWVDKLNKGKRDSKYIDTYCYLTGIDRPKPYTGSYYHKDTLINCALSNIDYILNRPSFLNTFKVDKFSSMLDRYFSLVSRVNERYGFTFPEFEKLFFAKTILGIFRQQHGYQEGTYVKIWDGVEDNVVLRELILNHPVLNTDVLLQELEEKYQQVISKKSE